jgi:hypothetical protein
MLVVSTIRIGVQVDHFLVAITSVGAEPFWQRFLTSAGFGGVMAVVAATIAGSVAMIQFRNSKKQQRNSRWWDTLTWVYDRSVVEEGKKAPLPLRVAFSMLTVLNEEAKTDAKDRLQGESISAILGMFEDPHTEEVPDGPVDDHDKDEPEVVPEPASTKPTDTSQIRVADPEAAGILHDLRVDLSRRGYGIGGMSSATYESRIDAILGQIAADLGHATVLRSSYDLGPDFVFVRNSIPVSVHVKYARNEIIPSLAIQWARQLSRQGPGSAFNRSILITNEDLTAKARVRFKESLAGHEIELVKVQKEGDEQYLSQMLDRLTTRHADTAS